MEQIKTAHMLCNPGSPAFGAIGFPTKQAAVEFMEANMLKTFRPLSVVLD